MAIEVVFYKGINYSAGTYGQIGVTDLENNQAVISALVTGVNWTGANRDALSDIYDAIVGASDFPGLTHPEYTDLNLLNISVPQSDPNAPSSLAVPCTLVYGRDKTSTPIGNAFDYAIERPDGYEATVVNYDPNAVDIVDTSGTYTGRYKAFNRTYYNSPSTTVTEDVSTFGRYAFWNETIGAVLVWGGSPWKLLSNVSFEGDDFSGSLVQSGFGTGRAPSGTSGNFTATANGLITDTEARFDSPISFYYPLAVTGIRVFTNLGAHPASATHSPGTNDPYDIDALRNFINTDAVTVNGVSRAAETLKFVGYGVEITQNAAGDLRYVTYYDFRYLPEGWTMFGGTGAIQASRGNTAFISQYTKEDFPYPNQTTFANKFPTHDGDGPEAT